MKPRYRFLFHFLLVIIGVASMSSPAMAIPPDPHPISVSAYFSPSTINGGETSTFHWYTPKAVFCKITGVPGLGMNQPSSGSFTVSPAGTLHARVQCFSELHAGSAEATLTVIAPPTVKASFNPSSITSVQSTTLYWSSTNATSCSANNGVSISGARGGVELSPNSDLTVTVTCTGNQGTGSDSAHVSVQFIPPPSVIARFIPSSISTGGYSNLVWDSWYANECFYQPAYGFPQRVGLSGSFYLGPFYNFTIVGIRCAGPGGSFTATAFLDVSGWGKLPSSKEQRMTSKVKSQAAVTEAARTALGLESNVNVQVKMVDLDGNDLSDQIIFLPQQQQLVVRLQTADGYHVAKTVTGIARLDELVSIQVTTDLDGQSTVRILTSD